MAKNLSIHTNATDRVQNMHTTKAPATYSLRGLLINGCPFKRFTRTSNNLRIEFEWKERCLFRLNSAGLVTKASRNLTEFESRYSTLWSHAAMLSRRNNVGNLADWLMRALEEREKGREVVGAGMVLNTMAPTWSNFRPAPETSSCCCFTSRSTGTTADLCCCPLLRRSPMGG